MAESNFIWGKHWDREFTSLRTVKLPPLTTGYQSFPLAKNYLTLFDESSYRYPPDRPSKKRDLLLCFNTTATSVEVERDFHPIPDCGLYRAQLQSQIRIKSELRQADKRTHHQLDDLMHQHYPFGQTDYRTKLNYQDRFPRIRAPHELGTLDERVG